MIAAVRKRRERRAVQREMRRILNDRQNRPGATMDYGMTREDVTAPESFYDSYIAPAGNIAIIIVRRTMLATGIALALAVAAGWVGHEPPAAAPRLELHEPNPTPEATTILPPHVAKIHGHR